MEQQPTISQPEVTPDISSPSPLDPKIPSRRNRLIVSGIAGLLSILILGGGFLLYKATNHPVAVQSNRPDAPVSLADDFTDKDKDGLADSLFDDSNQDQLFQYASGAGPEYLNLCQTKTDFNTQSYADAWVRLFQKHNNLTYSQSTESFSLVSADILQPFYPGDGCGLSLSYDIKINWFVQQIYNGVDLGAPAVLPNNLESRLGFKINNPQNERESDSEFTTSDTLSTINFNQTLAFADKKDAVVYLAEQKKLSKKGITATSLVFNFITGEPSMTLLGTVGQTKNQCYEVSMSLVTKVISGYKERECPDQTLVQ